MKIDEIINEGIFDTIKQTVAGKEIQTSELPQELERAGYGRKDFRGVGGAAKLAGLGFIHGLTGTMPPTLKDKGKKKPKPSAALKPGSPVATKTTAPAKTGTTPSAPTSAPSSDTKTVLGSVKVTKGGRYDLTPAGWVNALGQLVTDPANIEFLDNQYNLQGRGRA